MSRLIDRDTLKKSIIDAGQSSRRYKLGEVWELNGAEIEEVIDAQLPIEERKKGKWIISNTNSKVTTYKCSECGRIVHDDTGYEVLKDYPYCHCGADMRGKQE